MADNTGLAELLAFEMELARLESFARDNAPKVASEIGKVAKGQFRAGNDPYGNPWQPTKDGKKPFPKAAQEITFAAQGLDIVEDAPEHYKYHQNPSGRAPARKVFPDPGNTPEAWKTAAETHTSTDFFKRFKRFL
jgi:hypothetical protein